MGVDGGTPKRVDRHGVGPFVIYLVLSFLFFGRALAGHWSDRYIGITLDASQFMWYMRWWPYALAHRLNPFTPHVVWAPTGVNLAWCASISLPSIIAYPLTATLGLIPTYNLLCLLAPALDGWAAFLVCRYLTPRSYWCPILGGFIFAFSPYMLGKTFGSLPGALIFLVPLILFLVLLRLDERIRVSSFVPLLAGLFVMQFLFFAETFATMTLIGAIAMLLGAALVRDEAVSRLYGIIPEVVSSYAIAAIVLSPYLYYLLAYRLPVSEIMRIDMFSNDLANLAIPTPLNELGKVKVLGHIASLFRGSLIESGGYLSPSLIAIAVVFARCYWREPFGRLLIEVLLIVLVLTLGPNLHIFGHVSEVLLPWALITKVPLIQKALPIRLMQYAFLALAIITSIWLSESDLRLFSKLLVAMITVLCLLPNLSASYWVTDANVPKFFSGGLYKSYLSPGENVIVLPYSLNGDSMLWQAESNMSFNMVGGWTGFPIPTTQFENWPMVQSLISNVGLPNPEIQLKAFLASYKIAAIIVAEDCFCAWEFENVGLGPPRDVRTGIPDSEKRLWRDWFSTLGTEPIRTGGVLLYKVPLQELSSYKKLDAIQLSSMAVEKRFETLLKAASRYIKDGNDPSELSPLTAKELSLLPGEWISDLVNVHDSKLAPVQAGMLLSKWDNGGIAVGVIGTYQTLLPLVDKYSSDATLVRWFSAGLHPKPIEKPTKEGKLLLVLVFDRATLAKEASRVAESHDAAL